MALPDHLHEDTYEGQVLEVAALLMAADYVWDMGDADGALSFVRGIIASLDTEPWANGKHSGDCTNTNHTCSRCLFEDYLPLARRVLEYEFGIVELVKNLNGTNTSPAVPA